SNAVAACHIFLLADANIHEGDTIRQSDDWNAYKIMGSLNEISVIFSKGSPTLAGRKIPGNPIGFNSFVATRWDLNGSVTDFFPADPTRVEIEVDDDGHDCKQKTPLWLQ
ncbi:MAG: hypothetical protein Q8896_13570, partial [Bacteroidota bacterium]|nr:hypothetical protein [Bacteroidota bacterium]